MHPAICTLHLSPVPHTQIPDTRTWYQARHEAQGTGYAQRYARAPRNYRSHARPHFPRRQHGGWCTPRIHAQTEISNPGKGMSSRSTVVMCLNGLYRARSLPSWLPSASTTSRCLRRTSCTSSSWVCGGRTSCTSCVFCMHFLATASRS